MALKSHWDRFDPVICLCESDRLKDAVALAEEISHGASTVQLFCTDNEVIGRIIPAYINAYLRSSDGSMRTKSIRSEMLIFVSGKTDISKAMAACGARENRFVVFSSDKAAFKLFVKKRLVTVLKMHKPSLDLDVAQSVAATELRSE